MNSKQWQKESDGWVKMIEQSNQRKQKKKELSEQQGYKVEIIFTTPLNAVDPFNWIAEAVEEGHWKYQTNAIHATSVEPIDVNSDEYKWLRDASKT